MSKKKKATQVIDTKDYFKKGWSKPTNPSPAPADIAPLPPQPEGSGESKPQQGESGNPPPKQSEGGKGNSKGK